MILSLLLVIPIVTIPTLLLIAYAFRTPTDESQGSPPFIGL